MTAASIRASMHPTPEVFRHSTVIALMIAISIGSDLVSDLEEGRSAIALDCTRVDHMTWRSKTPSAAVQRR